MELSPPPPGTRRVSISNPRETSGRHSITPASLSTHPPKLPSKLSAFPEGHRPSIVSRGSLRSPSPLPPSTLQRPSLTPPEGHLQGKASTASSVHYADEESKLPSGQDKDKDKEKGKSKGKGKSPGNRLLNVSGCGRGPGCGHGGGWAEAGRLGVPEGLKCQFAILRLPSFERWWP